MSAPLTLVRPTEIVMKAAGRSPVGQPAASAGHCAMCGFGHAAGDLVLPFAPADSFTDWASLGAPQSEVICGWCAGAWDQKFMQSLGKAVFCKDGAFGAASNVDIARWLTEPPEPPFVFVQSDQKVQHLFWRTPVSYSRDHFIVRFGEKLLSIRRPVLLRAVPAARRLAAAVSVGRKGPARKSPFVMLDRELSNLAHGAIPEDVRALAAADQALREDLALIESLTPGELWGLRALIYAEPGTQ